MSDTGFGSFFKDAVEESWKYTEVWFPANQEASYDKPFRFIIKGKEFKIPWDQALALHREITKLQGATFSE